MSIITFLIHFKHESHSFKRRSTNQNIGKRQQYCSLKVPLIQIFFETKNGTKNVHQNLSEVSNEKRKRYALE